MNLFANSELTIPVRPDVPSPDYITTADLQSTDKGCATKIFAYLDRTTAIVEFILIASFFYILNQD